METMHEKHVRICHSMVITSRFRVLGSMGRSSKGGKVPSSEPRLKSISAHHVRGWELARTTSRFLFLHKQARSPNPELGRLGRETKKDFATRSIFRSSLYHGPHVFLGFGISRAGVRSLRFVVVKAKNHNCGLFPSLGKRRI